MNPSVLEMKRRIASQKSTSKPLVLKPKEKVARYPNHTAKRIKLHPVCYYCGVLLNPEIGTTDHVVPLSRGGDDTESNKVSCCKKCNKRKGSLLPSEYGELLRLLELRRGNII